MTNTIDDVSELAGKIRSALQLEVLHSSGNITEAISGDMQQVIAQALTEYADRRERGRPSDAQLDSIYEQIRDVISARRGGVTISLNKLQGRQVAQVAVDLVVQMLEGPLPDRLTHTKPPKPRGAENMSLWHWAKAETAGTHPWQQDRLVNLARAVYLCRDRQSTPGKGEVERVAVFFELGGTPMFIEGKLDDLARSLGLIGTRAGP
jgi:hypothetical protein